MILLWICVCWMSYEVHAIRKSVDENNLLIGVNQYCITVLQDAKLAELRANPKIISDEYFFRNSIPEFVPESSVIQRGYYPEAKLVTLQEQDFKETEQ